MRFRITAVLMLGALSAGALGCDESHSSTGNPASPTDPSRSPTFAAGDTGGGGGGGSQVVTNVSNGDQANGYWYDAQWDSSYTYYSFRYGYVNVNRGGTPSSPTTFLYYYVTHCNYDYANNIFSCGDDANGYGTIPNGAFTGGGRQLRLRLSAAQAPGLVIWAGTGALNLSFTKSGLYSTSSTGVNTIRYGNFSYEANGQASGAAATIAGNLDGVTVPATAQGMVGTSHQTTIYRYHK